MMRIYVSGKAFKILFLLLLAATMWGCGKEKTEGAKGKKVVMKDAVPSFNPAVLLDDSRTSQFTFELPPIQANLAAGEPWAMNVRVILETGDAATSLGLRVLRDREGEAFTAVAKAFETKTKDYVMSPEGKMTVREEILKGIQALVEKNRIKQVYFELYFAVPSKR